MSKKQCCASTYKGSPCKGNAVWYALPFMLSQQTVRSYCGVHVGLRTKFKTLEEAQLELLRRQL